MKKQILAMVLTLCMVVSMLPAKALAVSDFSDMPNDYFTEALQNAVKNGLLSGYNGKIFADGNLTRAQMAAVLVRAFGADKAADLTAFSDVTPDAWYYNELSYAMYMDIIKGDGTTMRPNAPITRQEAFVMLARAFVLKTENTSILEQFSDKASIGEWAKKDVAAMVVSGFIKGDGASLNPLSNITRKEFAVVMDRMVETYIKESDTVTTLPDGSVMINKPNVTLKGVTVKGNLIIGDGVGDGGVTLDNVSVKGDIVVRGGGNFVVKGHSSLGIVNISKVDGNVRVAAEVSAEVEVIAINNGKNDVVIEGKANKLETYSAAPVRLKNAIIKEVSVATPNAEVTVGEGTKVESVTVTETAKVTSLEVAKDATVTTVYVKGENIKIDGDGRVEKVNVTGNNVVVNTEGTQVVAAENVSGVLAGSIEVKPNHIVMTPVKKPSTGGNTPNKYKVTDLTRVNKTDLVFRVRKPNGKYIQSSELYNHIDGTGTYRVRLMMEPESKVYANEADQKTDNDGTWLYVNYSWWKDYYKKVYKVIIEEGTVSEDKAFNVTKSYELMQGETWNTVSVTGISFDKETFVFANGEKGITLPRQIKPDLATNKDLIRSISNPEIINFRYSFSYILDTHNIGDTTVTYTTVDGGHTAQCNVKVVHYIIDQSKNYGENKFQGDGTSVTPFANIQAALDKAGEQSIPNPVIYFVNNTYSVAEENTITIPEGVTLTIPEGVTITGNGKIAGKGSLVIDGTIDDTCSLDVEGTINGTGSWLGKN